MSALPIDIRIRRDADYSDFTTDCNGRKFPVHKVVLCTKSSVIATALKGAFQVGIGSGTIEIQRPSFAAGLIYRFKEQSANVYEIKEFEADTVNLMIDAMYYGDYSTDYSTSTTAKSGKSSGEAASPGSSKSSIAVHCDIARIADYFDMQTLRNTAIERILRHWHKNWNAKEFITYLEKMADADALSILTDGFLPCATKHISELVGMNAFKTLELPPEFLMLTLIATTRHNDKSMAEVQSKTRDSLQAATTTAQTEIDSLTRAIYNFRIFRGQCTCQRGQHVELRREGKVGEEYLYAHCTVCGTVRM
ncbi:hypothetical protein KEM56_004488 [Ascosphaera pollenicola]|nr:hypothetical protein KEM56_004488 [Ascosphaera pollenicola]